MVKRNLMRNVFVKTFVISMGIFIIGFFIGSHMERALTSDLQSKTNLIENSIQEIELENLYLLSLTDNNCIFVNDIIRKTNNDLDDLADHLSGYSQKNTIFTKDDLINVKKKYSNLLVKAWLLQEGLKGECGLNSVSVLYFYERECVDCLIQGNVLTVLKNEFKESVMIFPFDHDLEVSTISLLESKYNVSSYPSVVVGNSIYGGIMSVDDVRDSICLTIPQNENCMSSE